MKPTYYLLLGVAALGAASCTDSFFEQYPSNSVTENNYYITDDDFDQGVAACYHKLKTQMGYHLNELAYRSDECCKQAMTVSDASTYYFDHFEENSSNAIMSDIWNAWYNGIYRCNDVLDHLEGREELPNYDKYRGEVLFMRSWWYFNLYRAFGGVPIAHKVVSPADAKTIRRCTDDEMYTLLTGDLAEAARLLPASKGAEKARVTDIAAWTLLAKVYLTFGKPGEAKTALEEAMKNPNYGLVNTTADAFNVKNKFNKEIIFALYYNKANDTGHGYWYSTTKPEEAQLTQPAPVFRALYDARDNRLPLISEYTEDKKGTYLLNKWFDNRNDALKGNVVENDFPHLRYADVVLMYAEALAESGSSLGDALVWLNKTRTRAGLDALKAEDIPSKGAFIEALADERGREFALEGHRWFDLVRLGLALDRFHEMGYKLDAHNLLFPIPQNQIEIVNDKTILWQNPGY